MAIAADGGAAVDAGPVAVAVADAAADAVAVADAEAAAAAVCQFTVPQQCGHGYLWADGGCHKGASKADPCEVAPYTVACRKLTCDALDRCVAQVVTAGACTPSGGAGPCGKGVCDPTGWCKVVGDVGKGCSVSGAGLYDGTCDPSAACIGNAGAKCAPDGFCMVSIWDGKGNCVTKTATGASCDLTTSDCKTRTCTAEGLCVVTGNAKNGKTCSVAGNGGTMVGLCDGAGSCITTGTVPCPPGVCHIASIDKQGKCVITPKPSGAPCPADVNASSCTFAACDGAGKCKSKIIPGNVCSVNSNPCLTGVCDIAGKCNAQPSPPLTLCGSIQVCNLSACDGLGTCVWQPTPGKVLVDSTTCFNLMCSSTGTPLPIAPTATLATPLPFLHADFLCSTRFCGLNGANGIYDATMVPLVGMAGPGSGICRIGTLCSPKGKLIDDPASLPRPSGTPCDTTCAQGGGLCDGKGTCVPDQPQFSSCSTGGPCDSKAMCNGNGVCVSNIVPGQSCVLAAPSPSPCIVGQCLASGACVAVQSKPGASCVLSDPGVATATCTTDGKCVPKTYVPNAPCGPANTCASGTGTAAGTCTITYAPKGTQLAPTDPLVAKLKPLSVCAAWTCDGNGQPTATAIPALTGKLCAPSTAPCTHSICQPDGTCAVQPNPGASCPTESLCTKGTCDATAACVATPDLTSSCPAAGPCWIGVCKGPDSCTQQPRPASTPCTSGGKGFCDGNGHCMTATTVVGSPCTAGPGCAQANPKGTLDDTLTCSAAKPDGTPCALQCIPNGTCFAGSCIGAAKNSLCKAGMLCNLGATCRGALATSPSAPDYGSCDWGLPVDAACSAKSGNCVWWTCLAGKGTIPGQCVSAPVVSPEPCDDGNACTITDSCQNSFCKGIPNASNACNDTNNCTGDWCDAKLGCQHLALDGLPCGIGAVCKGGLCVEKP